MERKATNYAVTRKQRRALARAQMIKEGVKKFNKVYHYIEMRASSNIGIPKTEPSFFSKMWREYYDKFVKENY